MKKMLILACMAIGIVACSKDDEKGPILSPSGNYMVKSIKVTYYADGFWDGYSVSSYAYDFLGRVVSMKTDYNWGDGDESYYSLMTNITYNGDEFFVSEVWTDEDEDGSINFSGDLNSDGYITRIWDEEIPCSFQYDSDGHYVSGLYDDGAKGSYSWHEGNIVREAYADDWGSYESMMKYNDMPAKNVNLDLSRFVLASSMGVCWFAFGNSDNVASVCIPLYGVNNSNFVESCMDDDGSYCAYQWSYNQKGLPTSCTSKHVSSDSDGDIVFERVFEFSYM